MRLAKAAVASLSPTVGAVQSNVTRMIVLAREMADADVTIVAFPEQVIGGYPPEDLVQWRGFLDGQRRELERFAARNRRLGHRLRARPGGCGRRTAVQLGGDRSSRPSARICPERKAAHLQRLLRGADVLARWAQARARRGGRPARRLHLPIRLRPRRHRSVRGRVVARRPDAPPLLLGRRDRRQCVLVAVSHGHREHAPRNAGDARRGQPDGAASTPMPSAVRTG